MSNNDIDYRDVSIYHRTIDVFKLNSVKASLIVSSFVRFKNLVLTLIALSIDTIYTQC